VATYLIGDIQGCYGPLSRLLDTIRFDPASDRLWGCGDLVNRGGKSLKVLRLLHGLGGAFRTTLGNHDLHLLASHHGHPDGNVPNREFRKILRSGDRDELVEWLEGMPLAHWFEEHGLLLVHAGVIPQWDLEETLGHAARVSAAIRGTEKTDYFRNMYGPRPRKWRPDRQGWKQLRFLTHVLTQVRFCRADGKLLPNASGPPGTQRKGYLPWFDHAGRRTAGIRIAFGHWAALGLRVRDDIVALDSGCVWGGKLSAFRLEDQQVIQVSAKA
jgi:bis(5'-nucleosyl)-tetraphosphatase (symmetrical)